jgi:hypothetical protein
MNEFSESTNVKILKRDIVLLFAVKILTAPCEEPGGDDAQVAAGYH